jgi:hypothetical protein
MSSRSSPSRSASLPSGSTKARDRGGSSRDSSVSGASNAREPRGRRSNVLRPSGTASRRGWYNRAPTGLPAASRSERRGEMHNGLRREGSGDIVTQYGSSSKAPTGSTVSNRSATRPSATLNGRRRAERQVVSTDFLHGWSAKVLIGCIAASARVLRRLLRGGASYATVGSGLSPLSHHHSSGIAASGLPSSRQHRRGRAARIASPPGSFNRALIGFTAVSVQRLRRRSLPDAAGASMAGSALSLPQLQHSSAAAASVRLRAQSRHSRELAVHIDFPHGWCSKGRTGYVAAADRSPRNQPSRGAATATHGSALSPLSHRFSSVVAVKGRLPLLSRRSKELAERIGSPRGWFNKAHTGFGAGANRLSPSRSSRDGGTATHGSALSLRHHSSGAAAASGLYRSRPHRGIAASSMAGSASGRRFHTLTRGGTGPRDGFPRSYRRTASAIRSVDGPRYRRPHRPLLQRRSLTG